MLLRTDSDTVIEALGENYGPKQDGTLPSLSIFMRMASATVDRVVACANTKGIPLSDEEALLLETLLAAHNYSMSDQIYTSRSTEGASGSFQGQTGLALDGSRYGQSAKLMDPSGCLLELDSPKQTIGVDWLGKPCSEQIPVWERD